MKGKKECSYRPGSMVGASISAFGRGGASVGHYKRGCEMRKSTLTHLLTISADQGLGESGEPRVRIVGHKTDDWACARLDVSSHVLPKKKKRYDQ